jgi:RHS repeat-associated protein
VCFQTSCPAGSDPYIRWTYDPVGNRLTEQRPAGTTNYTYNNADELTQVGPTSYTFDANGNQTAAGSRTFTYDLANRLATLTDTSTTTYSYDGEGNRTRTSEAGQTIQLLWDPGFTLPQVALERDGVGALLRRYIYGDRRISLATSSASSYYHYDLLGSAVNLTSSNGTTQWTYAYEPFGFLRAREQNESPAPDNNQLYTGELLTAAGLYSLRAREFDPITGRFLQRDPVPTEVLDTRMSSFAYAANRPIAYLDPSGRMFRPANESKFLSSLASSPDAQCTRCLPCAAATDVVIKHGKGRYGNKVSGFALGICTRPVKIAVTVRLLVYDRLLRFWLFRTGDVDSDIGLALALTSWVHCGTPTLWKTDGHVKAAGYTTINVESRIRGC